MHMHTLKMYMYSMYCQYLLAVNIFSQSGKCLRHFDLKVYCAVSKAVFLLSAVSLEKQVHTFSLMHMHAYIHAYMHAFMHTYIHTYMHTCMHTYVHACMHSC